MGDPLSTSTLEPKPRIEKVRAHRRFLGQKRGNWLQSFTLVVVLILFLTPVVPAVWQSFLKTPLYVDGGAFTISAYKRLFADEDFGTVIINSLELAVITTVISLVVAVVLSILTMRIRVPGGRIFHNLMLWPIYISPLILAFGFIIVYGPAGYVTSIVESIIGFTPWRLYSIPGMAVASSIAFTPLAYMYCSNALRNADTALENAARTSGAGPRQVIIRVILPLMRPPVMYSGLIIFAASLEELSIPLLLGQPVQIELFGSFLYDYGLDKANPDYGVLGAATVLFLLVLVVLVTMQGWALRNSSRFISVRGKATRPQRFDVGGMRWAGLVVAVVYLVFGPGLPLVGLVARAFTQVLSPLINPFEVLSLGNFQIVLGYSEYTRSIGNSLIVAIVGALVTTAIALAAVLVSRRSTFRFGRAVELVSFLPQALPGIVIGIGVFWAVLFVPFLRPLQGSLTIIIFAFCIGALPAAFGAISPMVMQVSGDLDQASRVSGADWWTTVSRILFRLLLPALFSSFVLVFVTMIKAYAGAVFLVNADTNIIGTTNLTLWTNGNTGAVAALSCLQILLTTIVVLIAGKVFRVKAYA